MSSFRQKGKRNGRNGKKLDIEEVIEEEDDDEEVFNLADEVMLLSKVMKQILSIFIIH